MANTTRPFSTFLASIQTIDVDEDKPSPVWLADRHKLQDLQRRAFAQDWKLSRLIEEVLALGYAPIINYPKQHSHANN